MKTNFAHLERGRVLRDHGRHELAVDEFQQQLLETPDDADTHILLAVSLARLGRYQESRRHAGVSIGLAPESSESHFTLAYCCFREDHRNEALASINEAIRLNPHDKRLFNLRGRIHLACSNIGEAMSDANAGLTLAPEHLGCLELHFQALKAGEDRGAAISALRRALGVAPENATLHAEAGWLLLETGDVPASLEHFSESLRLNPNGQWARDGLIEAMKSRYRVYRMIDGWLSNLVRIPEKIFLGGIVLAGFALWGALKLMQPNAELATLQHAGLQSLLFAVALAVVIRPLFDATLLLNRFGRRLLSSRQKRDAVFAAAAFLVCTTSLMVIRTSDNPVLVHTATTPAIQLLLVTGAVLNAQPGMPQRVLLATATLWLGLNMFVILNTRKIGDFVWIGRGVRTAELFLVPLFLMIAFGVVWLRPRSD